MKKHILLSTILIVALALLTVMTGCGKNKSSETKLIKHKQITIAYIAAPIAASPQVLMNVDNKVIEKYLAKEGIKVKWVRTRSLDNIYPMMDKETVDFVYLPAHATTTYVTETSSFGGSDKFRIIAGSLDFNQYNLMIGKSVKGLKDLDGKKVGIVNHNYNEEMLLNKQLEKVGLKTKSQGGTVDVEYQDIFGKLVENFTAGKYDAISTWTPNKAIIEEKVPGSRILLNTGQGVYDKPVTNVFLITKKDFIQKDPELVKIILRAHLEATDIALANKDRLPLLAEQEYNNYFETLKASGYTKYTKSYYREDWNLAIPTYDPNTAYLNDIYKFDIKGGYLKGKTLANFMDLKLLNEVLKEKGKAPIH